MSFAYTEVLCICKLTRKAQGQGSERAHEYSRRDLHLICCSFAYTCRMGFGSFAYALNNHELVSIEVS